MFQSKYVVRLLFIALLLVVIGNIIQFRYFMIKHTLTHQVEQQTNFIVEMYKKEVWRKNSTAVLKLQNNKFEDLLYETDFLNFIRSSLKFFTSFPVLKVSIYDKSGVQFLTNSDISFEKPKYSKYYSYFEDFLNKIDKYFLGNLIDEDGLSLAYRGQNENVIQSGVIILNSDGEPIINDEKDAFNLSIAKDKKNRSISCIVSTYFPITGANNYNVEGVIEITRDLTVQWRDIKYITSKALIISLLLFTIFFSIIIYNTHHAQKMINRQQQMNKDLEDAIIRAELESRSKTDFLANVSHELRTPLNAIIGFSEILLNRDGSNLTYNTENEYIEDINNSGKHLLSIINDILDFSKAASDKLKVENVEVDLNKIVRSSLRFVKPRADKAGVILEEKFSGRHVIISADQKRLKQALLNLLSNAVKFTKKGRKVTLTYKLDLNNKLVEIIVKDQGIGIDEQDIPKALSAFGQIDSAISREFEGTGLGLPLTKKLIELMGGKFKFDSKKGRGTKIGITFKYLYLD